MGNNTYYWTRRYKTLKKYADSFKKNKEFSFRVFDENKNETDKVMLDERLLLSPTLAISECYNKTMEMGELSKFNFINSVKMLKTYRYRMAKKLMKMK